MRARLPINVTVSGCSPVLLQHLLLQGRGLTHPALIPVCESDVVHRPQSVEMLRSKDPPLLLQHFPWNLSAGPSVTSPAKWECCILMLNDQIKDRKTDLRLPQIYNRISITTTYFVLRSPRRSEMNVQDKGCESMWH